MFTHTYFVPRPPRLGHDAVIRTTSQGLVQPHRLLLIPPIIPRLNLAVVPSMTTNSPRLKLFPPIFVLLIPETQKLCVRLFLFLYSPFHTTTHRSAHVARVVSDRTPRPPPRLRPQSLFPPVNTQTAFQKFIKLISRRSHRSQPTIPRPNYFSRIFEFLIPRNAKKDIFTSRNFF